MKKIVIAVLIVALIVAIGTVGAFAAGPAAAAGRYYVDADGDGVCDNYGDCANGKNYMDADGDDVCDNYGNCARGQYYVDDDGDGICDNYGACGNYAGRGHCRGQRLGINW